MPTLAAALLVGLLPAQSLALPPDPAQAEVGRETLTLEELDQEKPLEGEPFSRHLQSLRADIPKEQVQAPPGTVTPPSNVTGTVDFGSTASQASLSTRVAAAEETPVGNLPVSLGQAADEPAPTGTWQVTIPDRTSAVSEGIDGTVMVVRGPETGSVPVSVKLDYSKFKSLYGADWASRLRLVQFPDCYLDTPDDEACQAYEELETVNDEAAESVAATVDPAAQEDVTPAAASSTGRGGSGVVQAAYRTSTSATTAAASGSTAVVGAVDSGGGAGGTFKATPLASDGKWEAGGSSGGFTWSYPLTVPPPPAGPTPAITFGYNSQTVDGRTGVSSPQASWIGEGWSYDPGYIERRYRPCQDDRKTLDSGTPNNTAKANKTSDLCWVSANAVMSLNGRTVELVRVDEGGNPETATEIYRPQQDDGTRVEHRTGGSNGDNNGEYWLVTTRDGTKYYYGQNSVGGGHADTNSVSTVPVFGNHPGEPCHAGSFADSRCGSGKQQAWRWGMDKVVDVNGNAMVVNWKQETNYYAVREKFKSPEKYDRYAYPTSIEYGMRTADLTKPSATVTFGVKQRCLKSESACEGANFAKTDDPGAYRPWWDTPGNLNCKSTSKLCPAFPSFWTQMRLDTVTTKAARAGQSGLGLVDKYTLHQSFPADWYDTSPGLWLNSITRTGYGPGDTEGTLQSKDGISFTPYTVGTSSPLRTRLLDQQLPNLVSRGSSDQRPGFTRPRIGTVSTELGGDIDVEYQGGCATEPATDKGKNNGTCFPVRWSPDGDEKKPAKAWFNKYVVASVTQIDKVTSRGEPITTKYKYSGAAWAKSDDEFTRPSLRTYSDWRGYREVTTYKGSKTVPQPGELNPQSRSVTRYFLGTGGEVKDSTGKYTLAADDKPEYAGTVAETIAYDDSLGAAREWTLNFPWSKQTASRARENEDGTDADPLLAHRVGIDRTDKIQRNDSSWRAVRTLTEVDDTYGLPIQVETAVVKPGGGGEQLSERTCTKTSYVHNTSDWLIGLPKEQRTTGTSCANHADADPATQLISAVRNSYDGQAYGASPTKGRLTSAAQTDGTGTSYSQVMTVTYDPLGRTRKVTAPGVGTTETQYTPGDSGGPVTSTKTINALGHTTTTTYDPGRALPLTVTDPNNRVTRTEYDALGRLVKGWAPSRSDGKSPNVKFTYHSAVATSKVNRPAAVTTETLEDDGGYARQVTVYDGLAREVQTQTEAHGPGRIITDTSYNDHGLVYEKTGAYLAKGEPSQELFVPKTESLIPTWTKFRYDGLEREHRASVYQGGHYKYATYTSYSDTSTWVNPPGSTTPTTRTYFDALGRVTSIKHYSKESSSATEGRTTTYDYDARGHLDTVTDPAGNKWTYTYDARGRVTSTTDPDIGRTDTWYDDADRPNRVKNAREQETFTEYDLLGRIVKVRRGSATATPEKEYTYDTAPGGIGQPLASIRHTDTGDYINRVTGYDSDYNVKGSETVIPANSMTAGLSGTYAYAYTYTPTGKPLSATLPAVGGLASEKVVTRYNSDGLPESTSGAKWYTSDVTYSPYGEVLRTVSAAQPYRVWTTNFVDPHTGRLQRTVSDRETAGPHRIADSYYSYDVSGTITSNARKFGDNTWDNQCFTYDVMGELVHAWTSNITPNGSGTGCKSTDGTTWGHRTNYAPASGPVAEAPDASTDHTSPDATLTSTLAAAAPDAATVSTGSTAYWQSFTFDWLANRAKLVEHDPADATKDTTFTYGYGKTVAGNGTTPSYKIQPHTMAWISSNPSGKGSSYENDATGNTKVRDLANTTQHLEWSPDNKLDSITDDGAKTTYVYDADGNRLLEHSPSGSTLYLGETEVTTNATGSITQASRAYAHPGAPTVVRTTTNGATTGHKLSVLIADHLGTANTSVEVASGQSITRRAFKPYGETRGTKPTNWPNKRSYLGVGIDDSTGLTHIGAREYDQAAGRFISADPVMVLTDPLQINGYAYSNNSPVTHSDPTGLCFADACGKGVPKGDGSGEIIQKAPVDPSNPGSGSPSLNDLSLSAYYSTVSAVAQGLPYVRTAKTISHQTAHQAMLKYQQKYNGPINDARWMMWLYGWDEEVIDNFGECLIFDCSKPVSMDDLNALPLSRMSFMEEFGRAYAAGAASRLGLEKPKVSKGRVAGDCTKCFLAGTDVLMANGETLNIEDVEVGDEVLATDPETGETGPRRVTRLIITESDKHFDELSIATEDGIEKLTATFEHPFWSPSEDDWVEAGSLTAGMTLLTDDGDTVIVTGNRSFTRHATTYNLTVDDLHTYYVLAGQTPVLVHNSNCGVRQHDKARGAAGVDEMTATFEKFYKKSDIYSESYGNGLELWTPYGVRQVDIAVRQPNGNLHLYEVKVNKSNYTRGQRRKDEWLAKTYGFETSVVRRSTECPICNP
ncbi:polymorphic toxin-type HINT domain-containing protein [Streptomyces sp. GXMU-J15]|uniref:Polymorphic toxin-type HINT domain-containing protein n=1 Tax=Streptomyces fuscus TaxID=3048495 RepID=A0ABT7J9A3_9ACTN|nr:polymorphic toxin-type HINT domain-containing protein [Streptomyces fuscus]MDL2081365.1 polymorphic toxin-type HINT domain-containing protein [Streptomyces fuscus]